MAAPRARRLVRMEVTLTDPSTWLTPRLPMLTLAIVALAAAALLVVTVVVRRARADALPAAGSAVARGRCLLAIALAARSGA